MEGPYSSQSLRSRTGSFSGEESEEGEFKGRGAKGRGARASLARQLLSIKASLGGLRAHKDAPIVGAAGEGSEDCTPLAERKGNRKHKTESRKQIREVVHVCARCGRLR